MSWLPTIAILASSGIFFALLTGVLRFDLQEDGRVTFLRAAVILGAAIWLSTEVLSWFSILAFPALTAFWSATFLLTALLFIRKQRSEQAIRFHLPIEPLGGTTNLFYFWLPVLFMGIAALIIFFLAIYAAPNNWDSMTYHLSRVMHWVQDGNIAFYPTSILRQLYSGPWAEMNILQLQILSGGDRLDNLVQCFAFIGSGIGVSYLAKRMGGPRETQVFAALVCFSIPMGILQATSTQNDYVVGFWLVCFAVFAFAPPRQADNGWSAPLAGVSLGLAVLTKTTAIFFAAPFGIWFTAQHVRRNGWTAWKPIALMACLAVVCTLPQAAQNGAMFGNPLGQTSELHNDQPVPYANELFTPAAIISNLSRNAALHWGTPIPLFNQIGSGIIRRLHEAIGISAADPRTTWPDTELAIAYSRFEDTAGNPLHFLLITIAFVFLLLKRNRPYLVWGVCLAAGFVLFSIILKWQPWNSRLQLPLFILAAPWIACILWNTLRREIILGIACFLVIASVPYMIANDTRPLVGPESVLVKSRVNQYFTGNTPLEPSYLQSANTVLASGCRNVGIAINNDDWEYPIWILLDAAGRRIRIEHIEVVNASAALQTGYHPCAILTTRMPDQDSLAFQGATYVYQSGPQPLRCFILKDWLMHNSEIK